MTYPQVPPERVIPNPASFGQAIAWQQRGDLARADAVCEQLLREQPSHADAWHLRGLLAVQGGHLERGADFIRRSLAANAYQPAAHANIGTVLLQLKRAEEALIHFEQALSLQPGSAPILYGRASALLQLTRFTEALADFDRALLLLPNLVPALCARGQTLLQLRRGTEALACLERARELAPGDADVFYHRGNALFELERFEEALASYERAAGAGLASAELLNNRGNALRELSRHEEALASYQQALQINPEEPETLSNRGNVLLDLGRLDEALACYDAALRVQPDCAVALDNRGLAYSMADRPQEAARSYARLLEITPHQEAGSGNWHNTLSNLLNARCMACDWTRYDEDRATVIRSVQEGRLLHPFPFLSLSDSAALQLQMARRFVGDKWGSERAPLWTGESSPRHGGQCERLRVAYVSADFREHVVSFLMAGVFEQHDRNRIETVGVSLRAEDFSPTGQRVKSSFDRFIDVTKMSDREIARLLRDLEIDVAVDLTGLTRGGRPGIFAHRPAPVQIGYLGYPGTMGAPFIDYILADDFVIPPESRSHYAEKAVYLPECFQANDASASIATGATRAAAGLPEQGLVLCCFSNSYKLNPPMFDLWMRLLREVPGSVLWLLATRTGTDGNLQREAATRGVDERRLVFARSLPYAEHLGRLGLADLFLDTLPYNAGATASDALRCGVPVLTCPGDAFAARMAGSLLRALDLPELITDNLGEYTSKALQLARDPEQLAALRAKLVRNLTHSPLFDTARFCRHLEAAYLQMHERATRGEAPVGFRVTPFAGAAEAAA